MEKQLNKLELLSLASDFEITKSQGTNEYEVICKNADLGANIFTQTDGTFTIEYFLTGCYNSGCDWLQIDMQQLEKLKKFCELMIGEE